MDDYDWLADDPFAGGKVWLWTYTPGRPGRNYLYDLQHQAILGELVHGGLPVLSSRDGSLVLCQGRDAFVASLKEKTFGVINKVLGGRLPEPDRSETFWFLDVRHNSATMQGAVLQIPGGGSGWRPSPGFRYGYTHPTFGYGRWFFLCDLEAKTFKKIPIAGEKLIGWWDEQHILVNNGVNEFSLLDVATQRRRALFSAASVTSFLAEAGLTNDPAGLGAFANWNGREYDFYFGPENSIRGLKNPDAYLLKADRAGPALKVQYRNFQFRWGGHLDHAGTHYLYQGEKGAPGTGGDGSVYLEDLTNGTTTLVVPPDNKGQYSIPRFYGNEVIYFQNRLLWRIQINSSNSTPLLQVNAK